MTSRTDRILQFTSRTHLVAWVGLALGFIIGAATAAAGNWGGLALALLLCAEAYTIWQSDRRFLFAMAELELSRARVQVEIRGDPDAVVAAVRAQLDQVVQHTAGES